MKRVLAIGAVAAISVAIVVIAMAPASLAGHALGKWTEGRVTLGDPAGTIWDGQADIILTAGTAGLPATQLPGRLAWHLAASRLLLGSVDLTLTDPAVLDSPLALRMDRASAVVDPDRLHLPATVLQGLGAPWNTIQPGGALQLEWDTLHVQDGALRGALRGEWTDASSRLSPVVPFGHYRFVTDGVFDGATLHLETLSGPMEMTGNGTIAAGNQLRFRGSARVLPGTDEATATQLSGLISLLGRRDGDGAILNFGT